MSRTDTGATPVRVALGLLLGCLLTTDARAAADLLGQVMTALASRQHGHVTYTEMQYLGVLDRPLQSSGELFYDAPDRIEKRTLRPRSERLVLDHGVVTVQRGRHKTELDPARFPQTLPVIDSIRATLAGDSEALERVFEVHAAGTFDDWRLELVPRDAKLARSVRQLLLQGRRDELLVIETRLADGDRSVMTIGPPLP